MSIVRRIAEKPLRDERTKNDYTRLSIDLGSADMVGSNIEIQVTGDKLAKIKYDGSATGTYFTFDHRHAAKIYANEFKSANRRFNKIYLTNPAAQASKVLILQLNELEVSEIEPDVTLSMSHLSEIEGAVETIEEAIHAEDAASGTGEKGIAILGIREDTDTVMAGTTGDYSAISIDEHGHVRTHDVDSLAKLATIDTDTGAIVTDAAAIEALAITIDADTGAIATDAAAIEVDVAAIEVDVAAIEVDVAAIEVLLGTIDIDTGNIATDAAAIETLLGTIDADTGSISVDTGSIDTTLTAMEIDLQTTASKLGTIDADTGAIAIDAAAIEALITAGNVDLAALETLINWGITDLAAIEVLLGTIDIDTGAIKTATENSEAYLGTIDTDVGKIAGSGTCYAKAVTVTVTSAAIEASAKMLNDVVIQNNHATVSVDIGTTTVRPVRLAPGDVVSFRLIDLNTVFVIRVGGANGTLAIIGSEQ